jgi:uncharacterized membrane protein
MKTIFFGHITFMIIRFFIYGSAGWLMEVLWTGLGSLKDRNFKLSSNTSLWMFFIYGMVIFLEPFFRLASPLNFLLRGLIYAVLIMSGEFVTGTLLKRADFCPWDYSASRFNVKGVVRLDYLPAWAIAGLFYEQLYFLIQ